MLWRLAVLLITICSIAAVPHSGECQRASRFAAIWGGITASAIVAVGYLHVIHEVLTVTLPPWNDEWTVLNVTAAAVIWAGIFIPPCFLFGAIIGVITFVVRKACCGIVSCIYKIEHDSQFT